ncbi:MAG: hypothetical protein GWN67_22940 [Phycisphaerae bacterium]|nr:hypothetical protein [Phycisphaerae bacterium]NIS53739.1 hypothetical protein [Phycisphaerae bacterium]NIU11318.1 hypothetical protein [Phycisphaerae bacterium]NIU59132.1 hypothetical protein [Phycisphaerae bacterium]NIW93893.1 hypothetical protein [Phycisphaerae bacterium]
MKHEFNVNRRFALLVLILVCLISGSISLAVNSKITRHSSSSDLMKGKTENIVIGSRGTLQLGSDWEAPVKKFEDVWSINSIVVSGGTVYIGTSPNGGIYKYSLGNLKKIYPKDSEKKSAPKKIKKDKDANTPDDANTADEKVYLSNEHIFAMATDVAGRLLAGISGDKCRLCRFNNDKYEAIFEPAEDKYIFAIEVDSGGNIYLGTGPEGKVYKLDSSGKKSQLIYDSQDKNILSLAAGQDGFIYAGSDSRGLVYKINPRTKTATVLYDSAEPEITALLFTEDGVLHAAATSAKIIQAQTKFATQSPFAGRPETKTTKSKDDAKGGLKLKIANIKGSVSKLPSKGPTPPRKPTRPGQASYIYKISREGFVTNVFSEAAVFFCLAEQDKSLLVGTGNSGQLFTVDPASEQEALIYEDKQASQITAINVRQDAVYLGTANPAKLIKLGSGFASKGTYISDLIDAGQPAMWGKLQIEADIPQGCSVRVASRSGNVKDVNDPTFSSWTQLNEVTQPVQLRCPLGRFCQYKLVLQSNGPHTPIVREIAVASSVPNLAPKVQSVKVGRIATPDKKGNFKISFKAVDENGDKMIYKIDFRKIGRKNWIELKDELETATFDWNGKTVEDGRYEVRVTASDERSNNSATKLTGSRISEQVIVDNTAPVIKKHSIDKDKNTITLKLHVSDEFSAIGRLNYTVDSNEKWKGTMPDDMVYDTTDEDFTIVIDKLETGEHIIAVRIADSVGNIIYKTFEVNIP